MVSSPTMEEEDYDYENSTALYEIFHPEDCPAAHLPLSHLYLPVLYFIIFFAGVSGNFFVVWVMCSKLSRRRLVDIFVVNLAMADLIFVVTVPLWAVSAAQHHRWAFGDVICRLSSYIIAINRFSNIFFLTCMSIDRYLAVVRMLDLRYLKRSQFVRVTCGVVWAFSFVLGVPSLLYRHVAHAGEATLCVEDKESAVFQGLSLATLFLAFFLPMSVILFCYSSILVRLQKQSGVGGTRTETRRQHSVKMVFTIIGVFVVSWLPFNFFKCILVICQLQRVILSCEAESFLARGLILSSCLAFLNSCANPVIYTWLDHNFRHRVKTLLQGCQSEYKGHLIQDPTSNSFSDSLIWLNFTRSRTKSVSRSSHLKATEPVE